MKYGDKMQSNLSAEMFTKSRGGVVGYAYIKINSKHFERRKKNMHKPWNKFISLYRLQCAALVYNELNFNRLPLKTVHINFIEICWGQVGSEHAQLNLSKQNIRCIFKCLQKNIRSYVYWRHPKLNCIGKILSGFSVTKMTIGTLVVYCIWQRIHLGLSSCKTPILTRRQRVVTKCLHR